MHVCMYVCIHITRFNIQELCILFAECKLFAKIFTIDSIKGVFFLMGMYCFPSEVKIEL
jgi:hypothetical protein